MTDRIDQIRTLLHQDPDDVFLHYSLGMELAKANRLDEALEAFRACIERDAGYLPARVELARALRSTGRLDRARQAFADALAAAEQAGETHTADALREQIDSLPPIS